MGVDDHSKITPFVPISEGSYGTVKARCQSAEKSSQTRMKFV
jgi:hypothetical protein